MKYLRTVFGKLIQLPRGEKITKRQQQILELCGFLKDFMRSGRPRGGTRRSTRSRTSRRSPSPEKLPSKRSLTPEKVQSITTLEKDQCPSPEMPEIARSERSPSSERGEALNLCNLDPTPTMLPPSPLTIEEQPAKSASLPPTPSTTSTDVKFGTSSIASRRLVPDFQIPSTSTELAERELPPTNSSFLPRDRSDLSGQVNSSPIKVDESQSFNQPMSLFSNDYFMFLRHMVDKTQFNVHEHWARLLAEKLKLLDGRKAEELKLQIDAIVLQALPEQF